LDIKHASNIVQTFVEVFRLVECGVRLQSLPRRLRVFELRSHIEPILVNQVDSLLFEPLHAFPVLPEAELLSRFIAVDIRAEAVLLSLVPPAFVRATIRPHVETVALLLIIVVLAVVTHAIRVYVNSDTRHIVVDPLAVVFAAVLPQVGAVAIDFIIDPLAFVR